MMAFGRGKKLHKKPCTQRAPSRMIVQFLLLTRAPFISFISNFNSFANVLMDYGDATPHYKIRFFSSKIATLYSIYLFQLIFP